MVQLDQRLVGRDPFNPSPPRLGAFRPLYLPKMSQTGGGAMPVMQPRHEVGSRKAFVGDREERQGEPVADPEPLSANEMLFPSRSPFGEGYSLAAIVTLLAPPRSSRGGDETRRAPRGGRPAERRASGS